MFNLKQMLVSGIASLVLMAGVAGTAVVGAQDDPTTPEPTIDETFDGRGGFFGGRDGRGPRGERGGFGINIDRAEIEVLLETYTGLAPDELRAELRGGATMAELIEANGQSVDDFVAEVAAPAYERINEAVANGRIDETQAETLRAEVTARLTERLQSERPRRGDRTFDRFNGEMLTLAESYTGLTAQEIAMELRGGATMADLITANGGDVDAFIVEAVALGEAQIDERSAQRKEALPGIIEALVNGERPNRNPPAVDGE